ncbi:6,7-dimethyl-8-ribityllumazine synthase [Candidatus Peregrinibacteria bacterium CG1_02_54_53]|nr:MAG: 6,7-dimethyl-8-ribityllumazine synthase [Candidatus Peregrinibacteria bacterium CG1_02_54_53]
MTGTSHPSFPARISSGWRIGIVHSSFYPEVVSELVKGAQQVLRDAGIAPGNVRTYPVSGSFEIPLIGAALIKEKEVDALIGLGVIVEGETHHARLIAEQTARGIMDLQVRHLTPFAFEILYVHSLEQARARLRHGAQAAHTVLHSLAQLSPLHS